MAILRDSFSEALRSLPKPGGGGYHSAVLGVANVGILCGHTPEEVFRAIRQHTRADGRRVPDREIAQAIEKAVRDCAGAKWSSDNKPAAPPPPFRDVGRVMRAIQSEGKGWTEADIWEASPVRIDWKPPEDAPHLLRALYRPEDSLFIGDRFDTRPRAVAEILASLEAGEPVPPHIIPNPLTGKPGPTKDGGESFRADSCVCAFRFAVAEFDELPRDAQIRFWAGVDLPVCALIDSGGKSIHGWIRIDGITSAEAWTREVEETLFRFLVPLGVDKTCRNEARLSRLPGHYRTEKARWQRLLYLAPQGRRVKV